MVTKSQLLGESITTFFFNKNAQSLLVKSVQVCLDKYPDMNMTGLFKDRFGSTAEMIPVELLTV